MQIIQSLFGISYKTALFDTSEAMRTFVIFSDLQKKHPQESPRLLVRREWGTGRLSLEAKRQQDVSFFDHVENFFFGTMLLLNIKTVCENHFDSLKMIPQPQHTIDAYTAARAYINKKISKKFQENGSLLIKEMTFKVLPQAPFQKKEIPLLAPQSSICTGIRMQNSGNFCFFNATLKAFWVLASFKHMIHTRFESLKKIEHELCAQTHIPAALALSDSHQKQLKDIALREARSPVFESLIQEALKKFLDKEIQLLETTQLLFGIMSSPSTDLFSAHVGPLHDIVEQLKAHSSIFRELLNHHQQDAHEFFHAFIATILPAFTITYMEPVFISRDDSGSKKRESSEIWEIDTKDSLIAALEKRPYVPSERMPSEDCLRSAVIIPAISDSQIKIYSNTYIAFPLSASIEEGKQRSLQNLFDGIIYQEGIEKEAIEHNPMNQHFVGTDKIESFLGKGLPGIRQAQTNQGQFTLSIPAVKAVGLRGAAPQILPIQILRFSPDGRNKSRLPVEIPVQLLVHHAQGDAQTQDELYMLRSVVIHSGTQRYPGHYYTYELERRGDLGLRWIKHDDDRVSIVEFRNIQQDIEQDGYLIFYEKI